MGAPKQKWTAEEEAALKAGIARYGVGKWSTILKDPEFSGILRSRSNVDLKDKWRNINVMANGWGSRQRGRPGCKSSQSIPKPDESAMAVVAVVENVPEVLDVKPVATVADTPSDATLKKPISRLDDLILEVVNKLKEPRGSSRATIASYIEEQYCVPSNFERTLAAKLKLLTENGQLFKVKHQYRIAPKSTIIPVRNEPAVLPQVGGVQKDYSDVERKGIKVITRAQIDADLDRIMNMSAEEAAAVAAQAVAEAEAAIAEAEAAAKEAEEAEAEAEASQCFAEATEAALKTGNYRSVRVW